VQIGKISRFGLLEMSRQRLRPSLGESTNIPCPRCDGQGSIRSIESLALAVLRIIEEEAIKDMTAKVIAQLPVDAATFLLNEKRQAIADIGNRHDVSIIIVPMPSMQTPQYLVQRVRLSETVSKENTQASYTITPETRDTLVESLLEQKKQRSEEPAIKQIIPEKPAPVAKESPVESPKHKGLITRLFGSLFGVPDQDQITPQPSLQAGAQPRREHRTHNLQRDSGRNRQDRRQKPHRQHAEHHRKNNQRKTETNAQPSTPQTSQPHRRSRRGGRRRFKDRGNRNRDNANPNTVPGGQQGIPETTAQLNPATGTPAAPAPVDTGTATTVINPAPIWNTPAESPRIEQHQVQVHDSEGEHDQDDITQTNQFTTHTEKKDLKENQDL
jgi:ribonuclease E